ncbi:ATP-dependent RNA helicase HrpA [Dasania marina]|uniref:ATP-dependent RNA helicase HrpA n=1 Tax=Dasania marina TaxID=471499 RepID=UPI0030DA6F35
MDTTLNKLSETIDQCLLKDQHSLRRKLRSAQQRAKQNQPVGRLVDELVARIETSLLAYQQKSAALPKIIFPEDLPIADKREPIAEAIRDNQVVIIAGETGSGKTTQLPKICLELGRGVKGLIGHTQPRRLAARTVAQRIADELQTPLGEGVGYQVRFTDNTSDGSYIKLMTDGILLAEIQRDRYLSQYDTLIIDEAHERSLNIDFLLGYLKQLLPKRPDLKLIITSATIDLESFSKHFGDAPVIEVSGRTYPVETRYRPLDDLSEEGGLAPGIAAALEELFTSDGRQGGDVLVFLSGEGDIREVSRYLRDQHQGNQRLWQNVEVLPLYARLSNAEQNKIFQIDKRRGRRVVLATNVAETSLTVPGIRYVIDPGFARISRYSYRTKIQRLPIEAISQASANQRKGRCGRVAEGICIRLYSEEDFNGRPEFTDPEIKRTNLASVILQMLSMRIGEVQNFPFVDPPDSRMINDGFALLEELGAVNKQQLTATGVLLAKFPLDPRLSRMLIAANEQGCVQEMLIICSALSVQDPRERPADKRQASDEKHRRFWHEDSDFLSYVNLWNHYEEQRQELSQGQLRKYCLRNYLSFMKMREWRDIHHQLKIVAKELGYKQNQEPASFEAVHRSLLAGLLSHVANLDVDKVYLGARNRKLHIFPGSGLFKKSPKWIAAAEIAETTQVYARCCARIQPEWLLGINDALFKHRYSEPHWQQRSGRVMAFETLSLYGLIIKDKIKVHYGPIDSEVAREIFIRAALVEGCYKSKAKFYLHNQKLLHEITELEAKSRRRDILIDDEQLYQFYHERLPPHITTSRQFEHWYKTAQQQDPQCLFLSKGLLMQHSATEVTEAQFPTVFHYGDMRFALSYVFEPGQAADGVTVTVPLALLNRISKEPFEWLVPGMLREKCITLVKMLPKQIRKQFVPVPDYVDKALVRITNKQQGILAGLADGLYRSAGVEIDVNQWHIGELDNFYRMNFKVVDADGKLLAQSRDLDQLLEDFKGKVSASVQQQSQPEFQQLDIKRWDFGELPAQYQFKQAGVTITSYPALVDKGDSVAVELMDYPQEAKQHTQQGLVRLLMLQLPQQLKYLRKELLSSNQISLQLAGLSEQRKLWLEDLLLAVFTRVFLADAELPNSEQAFNACLQQHQSSLVAEALEAEKLLLAIADGYTKLRKAIKKANQLSWATAVADINQQINLLFAKGFIADTPWQHLQQYPRYLAAIEQRIDKLRGGLPRDRQLMVVLNELNQPLIKVWQGNQPAHPELLNYRWLLEEYRVSLFAQTLGTQQPVSEKRLRKHLAELRQLQLVK